MPELPEVETVVRDLRPLLIGQRIRALTRVTELELRLPWEAEWKDFLVGQKFQDVQRRGKWIVIHLQGERTLVVHLGMTGQLTVVPADTPLAEHTHLLFDLGGQKPRQLRYRDVRRFGSVTVFTSRAEREWFFQCSAGLGPEPFELDPEEWRTRLASTSRCLKAVLLDQRVVAGVGNIYADEALFQAGLHPGRLARDLSVQEADKLREAITTVLTRAIEHRGSTIRDYVGGSGLRGGFQDEFAVYGRTAQPCRRCQTAIVQRRLAGRSSHYCPRCQPD